ncbi:hypothetical protein TrLO_g6123 [Triparma laevis f. longispina]|uniref:Golgi apparatus membrane protein TVP23 homolog n=1 Tax=Triparma laevis f. longispina TaxID=1714387 RepID=A0A9W7A3B0_9STRA|nr:hypothetical protein TrLO_g6123 [Triparma laevis f. longispina]
MATSGPEALEFVNIPQTSFGQNLQALPTATATPITTTTAPPPLPPPSLFTSPTSTISSSSHPKIAFLHILFKSLPLLLYCFTGLVSDNFIFIFVILILLLSVDFWWTKNVSGRKLVGLRWWSNVVEDGTTTWVYESSDTTNPNKSDSSIFWTFLYLPFLLWSIFTFLLLIRLKFQWLPINLVSLSLSGANIYGYYKCSKEQKGKLDNLMRRGMETGIRGAMGSGAFRGAVWDMFSQGDAAKYEQVPGQSI